MSKKDEKLTNFQVPRDPKMAPFDAMTQAPPFNPDDYKDVGKVHNTQSLNA